MSAARLSMRHQCVGEVYYTQIQVFLGLSPELQTQVPTVPGGVCGVMRHWPWITHTQSWTTLMSPKKKLRDDRNSPAISEFGEARYGNVSGANQKPTRKRNPQGNIPIDKTNKHITQIRQNM